MDSLKHTLQAKECQDIDSFARCTIELLGPEPADWVRKRDGVDHDVTVIGGGQSGVAIAYALRRKGIRDVSVIDSAHATDESPWLYRARMNTLRTPKTLVGPELDVTGLGFRAWFEARYGKDAYDALVRIPRPEWARYVTWFRKFVGVEVRYSTRLLRVEPLGDFLRLHLEVNGVKAIEVTRKVVIATGVGGSGGPVIPTFVSAALPKHLYAHTDERIDFSRHRGKVVGVVGSAASAFDAAATALEAGAAEVHLFSRRPDLPSQSTRRHMEYPGAYDNYASLPDAARWMQGLRLKAFGNTAPRDSLMRVLKFDNFKIHLGSPVTAAEPGDLHTVRLQSGSAVHILDFLILGTGYAAGLDAVPELVDIKDDVLLWKDKYVPDADHLDAELGTSPYYDEAHALMEKIPQSAPHLRNIHIFNLSGLLSFGLPVGDVPSFERGIPAIVTRISRDFFEADLSDHVAYLESDTACEFTQADYAAWVFKGDDDEYRP